LGVMCLIIGPVFGTTAEISSARERLKQFQ
jgi:hypothetical protein